MESYRCKGAIHAAAIGDAFAIPIFFNEEGDPSANFVQKSESDTILNFEEIFVYPDDFVIGTNDQRVLYIGDRPVSAFYSKSNGLIIGNKFQLERFLEAVLPEYPAASAVARDIRKYIGKESVVSESEMRSGGDELEVIQADYEFEDVITPDINVATGLPVNEVIQGDCIEIMRTFPDNSVDLVVADPPCGTFAGEADVGRSWDGGDGVESYDLFSANWLAQARRVLKPSGALWVIGSYENIFRIGALVQAAGFWIMNDVIWRKSNPLPNFKGTGFTVAHATLIWAAKSKDAKPTFNYAAMKALNDGVQMRSDWTLPVCSRNELIKDKEGNGVHPAQKPEALLHRILLSTSNPGEVVLDPFFGTGTSGAAARRLGRHFIGIEVDPNYVRVARNRVSAVRAHSVEALQVSQPSRMRLRIIFGDLVERGLVRPGDTLWSADGRFSAVVLADGTVVADGTSGSIHQVGAKLQGASSCNGWLFWHLESGKGTLPIAALRDQIRDDLSGTD
ncbi:site-specific DNA-methyltransferase [uncultured Maricaulis sp.]|uniref:site-specific DNA-methyltransferase n=1 Tax=uncultured Maricaulis sp. TaxID=174710 RepID=UPI0030DD6DF0